MYIFGTNKSPFPNENIARSYNYPYIEIHCSIIPGGLAATMWLPIAL